DATAAIWLFDNAKNVLDQSPAFQDYLYRVAFAMFTLFRVFGEEKFVGLGLSDHPPSQLRRLLCMVWAMRVITMCGQQSINGVPSLMGAWFAVDGAFAILTETPCSPMDSLQKYSEVQGQLGR